MKKKVVSVLFVLGLAVAVGGCGNSKESDAVSDTKEESDGGEETDAAEESDASGEMTTITVACVENDYPLHYVDEDGNLTGYEIEALKLVDEALEQYEFEYVEAAMDAIYTGLSTGKYNMAAANAFYTAERGENYNIPENPIGAGPVGLVVSAENSDITTIEEVAERGLSGAPFLSGHGLTYWVEQYNEEHPDAQLQFEYTDSATSWQDAVTFVAEGRYEYTLENKAWWSANVEEEDGALHTYDEQLIYIPIFSVPTYVIVEKGNDELTEAVSEQLGILKENGMLEELSQEFLGFNVFDATE